MALNFPDSPFVGQIYSDVTAGFSYVWDGTVWKSYYQSDQTPDGTVTPPKLSPGGPVWNTSGDLNVTGILTAANISVAGTITYNDVTSVDSIGVVTARSGVVVVGGGVSVAGGGIDVNGHTETDTLRVSGVSTFQNHVYVTGQNRLYFGSSDLGIFYQTLPSASNYIVGFNNVPLTIWADNLTLGAQNGENFATFTTNGSASLYYDNSKKFETLGTGVTITGTTFTNQLNVSGVSTFTNSINLNAGNLKVATDGIIKIGNSDQLELYYNGSIGQTIKSTGDLRILTNRLLLNNSANDEQLIEANQNGSVALYYDNSKKFETTGAGVTITGQVSASAGVLAGLSTFTNIRLANDAGANTSQYVTAIGQNYVIGFNTGGGYPENKYFQFSSGNPNFILENVGIGTTTATEKLTVKGDVGVGGTLTIQQTTEVLNTKTGAGNTVTHDFSTGSIWYHSGITTDFILNLTNVPTTENRSITVTLFLDQGGTGYYANGLEVDGVTQTIKWANNATPIPSTNKLDVQSFTLIRTNPGTGVTWVTLGQLINYN